jgi:hypothetical protein
LIFEVLEKLVEKTGVLLNLTRIKINNKNKE